MLGNFMASLFSEVEKTVLRAAFELQSKQESQNKVKRQCDCRKRQLSVWDTWCNGYSASP